MRLLFRQIKRVNWFVRSCPRAGVCWLLATGWLITICQAQTAFTQFRFEHITVDDGLAHSDAMCAEQDTLGFLWIGTNSGINRYNGYELTKYLLPVNSRNGLSGNRIRDLYVDSRNQIWVGAENAGLSVYDADHDRFISVSQRVCPSVNKTVAERLWLADVEVITSDKAGRIWVGTRTSGVFVLTMDARNRPIRIQQVALPVPTSITYRVSALVTDRDGTVWIGTADMGLWSVGTSVPAVSLPTAKAAPLTAKSVRALHIDRHNNLWIGTNQQIFWVNQADRQARRSFSTYSLPQTVTGTECIYSDSFGHLWVGTVSGLLMWAPRPIGSGSAIPVLADKLTTFSPQDGEPYGINATRIEQIFEDRNQILWLSTAAGGLNKVNLRHKPFNQLQRRVTDQLNLTDNLVNTIQKDEARNELWIGTSDGFARYDLTTGTYLDYKKQRVLGDTRVDVSAFCLASDGTLWVGTHYNGLMRLKAGKLTTQTTLPDQPSLSSTRLESIVEDRHGTIWIASYELGLLRYNRQGQLLERYHTGNSPLPTNRFTFLLYDKEKDWLWASTQNAGVLKLQPTTASFRLLKQFNHQANDTTSLSVNYAWPLLKDRRGQLWIGTIGGGLNLLTTNAAGNEVIQRFDRYLPVSDVESLLADEAGQLWIGGSKLVRFDPTTSSWVTYAVEDGLQSNAFKVGAAWRANDGTLYFGGTKGITYFQPRQIQPNPYAPVVHLTGLRILNKSVGTGEPLNGHVVLPNRIDQTRAITLRASENDFSVEFVGLNYANTRTHTYAYRLDGYNSTWVMPTPGVRSASFANLPAGNYTFAVKASNGEGQWSTRPATLQITILPPWYKTWLAYLLYAIVLVGALLVYRQVTLTRQQLKSTLALEKFRTEKEKEMTDLKLRFFTNISHELRTPLTLILGPMEELATAKALPEFRQKISLMHQQTRKLLKLVNQLMEFRKVEAGHVSLRASEGDIVRFLTEIFLIFRLKADELQMDYTIEVPALPVLMHYDRNKLEIVLTNLLANALKYTPVGGKIRLFVATVGSSSQPALFLADRLLDNYLQITVRDWGVGMKTDEASRIFDSYYQASHTETMDVMGTGIGLSLVKQYVEAHAGEVTVQTEPGAGTAFTIRLPFGHKHLSPANIVDKPLANEMLLPLDSEPNVPEQTDVRLAAIGTARILIVEDNDELRQYLQLLFKPMFVVSVAADGVEGWEKTLSLLPNLVISDVLMPRSDGLTLCRQIKQHPKTEHIPVVLLTARVAAVHELEGIEMGADEYMAKPFNPKVLYAKIAAVLQGRHQLKEYYQRQILLEPANIAVPDRERQLLEKAMTIVEANLSEPAFNVPMLVREMGMSQSTFYRQIKAITGQSVVEFIRDIRMKRAAQLLIGSNLRISEVAAQVGLEDINHFRKTFHSVYNISPSDYAKQHQQLTKTD